MSLANNSFDDGESLPKIINTYIDMSSVNTKVVIGIKKGKENGGREDYPTHCDTRISSSLSLSEPEPEGVNCEC